MHLVFSLSVASVSSLAANTCFSTLAAQTCTQLQEMFAIQVCAVVRIIVLIATKIHVTPRKGCLSSNRLGNGLGVVEMRLGLRRDHEGWLLMLMVRA